MEKKKQSKMSGRKRECSIRESQQNSFQSNSIPQVSSNLSYQQYPSFFPHNQAFSPPQPPSNQPNPSSYVSQRSCEEAVKVEEEQTLNESSIGNESYYEQTTESQILAQNIHNLEAFQQQTVPRTAKFLWPPTHNYHEPQVYETADFYPQEQSEGSLQTIDDRGETKEAYLLQDPISKQLILVDQNGEGVIGDRSEGGYPESNMESQRQGAMESTFKGMVGGSDYQDNDCQNLINDNKQMREYIQMIQGLVNNGSQEESVAESNYGFLSNEYDQCSSQPVQEEDTFDEEERQRMMSDSLGVQDHDFKENLRQLYQRRIDSSKKMMEQLSLELAKSQHTHNYVQGMLLALQNNKQNAVAQLKLQHHMLVLQVDQLLEQALDGVFENETQQSLRIGETMKASQERMDEIEAMIEMLQLKIRAEKKTKFVQYYPDLKKQVERAIQQWTCQELELDPCLSNLDVPEFNYQVISQEDLFHIHHFHKQEFAQSVQTQTEVPERERSQLVQRSYSIEDWQPPLRQVPPSQTEHQSIDHGEIGCQAKNIRSKLKQLKKETEYAKKLILNEKKLDHLLGVLDKSRESIIKQSISAFDDNQLLLDQPNSYRHLPPDHSRPPRAGPRDSSEPLVFSKKRKSERKKQSKIQGFSQNYPLNGRDAQRSQEVVMNANGRAVYSPENYSQIQILPQYQLVGRKLDEESSYAQSHADLLSQERALQQNCQYMAPGMAQQFSQPHYCQAPPQFYDHHCNDFSSEQQASYELQMRQARQKNGYAGLYHKSHHEKENFDQRQEKKMRKKKSKKHRDQYYQAQEQNPTYIQSPLHYEIQY